jgi:hypothetical protein
MYSAPDGFYGWANGIEAADHDSTPAEPQQALP